MLIRFLTSESEGLRGGSLVHYSAFTRPIRTPGQPLRFKLLETKNLELLYSLLGSPKQNFVYRTRFPLYVRIRKNFAFQKYKRALLPHYRTHSKVRRKAYAITMGSQGFCWPREWGGLSILRYLHAELHRLEVRQHPGA